MANETPKYGETPTPGRSYARRWDDKTPMVGGGAYPLMTPTTPGGL